MLVLPAATRTALDAGDLDGAGVSLLAHGENLVRTRPSAAMEWATQLVEQLPAGHTLTPFAAWTAGVVHHLTGGTARARDLLEQATRSFTARRRPDLADRVRLLLVDVHGERLDLGRARRLARTIAARFRARGDHERAASALANLACAEDAADHIVEATRLWRQALRRLPDGGMRHLLVAANLANVAATLGRFDRAAEGHRQVAAMAADRGLTALELQARLNLAETEFATGQVDAAFAGWLEVMARAGEAGNPLIELVAAVELAQAEMTLGLGEAAARRLHAALPRLEELGLGLEVARVVRLLALHEATSESPDRALIARARDTLADRGLELQLELLEVELAQVGAGRGPERLHTASRRLARAGLRHRSQVALACAAHAWLELGDAARAQTTARQVLASRIRSPWTRMVAHHVCARALGMETAAGGRHLGLAVRAADRVHSHLGSTADRCSFLRTHGEVYLAQVQRLVERGRTRDRQRCLELIHRLKSGWLLDQLTQRCDRGSDPLVQRWQELRRRVAALLESCRGEDEPRIRHSAVVVNEQLRRLERELGSVEADLARSRPALAQTVRPSQPAHDLQDLLPDGHLLVEYLVAKEDVLVFAIGGDGVEATIRRGAAGELASLLASVRFQMDAHPWAGQRCAAERRRCLEARLARVSEILLDEVMARPWTALWLAPHDGLYHLPWAALPDAHGVPLLDHGPFTLVPGAAAAAELLRQPNRAPRRVALAGAASHRLPMVGHEIDTLARLVPGSVRVGEVTRECLLELLATSDAVHLAGHAVFMDGAPSASGLSLEDGFLTVHDLAASPISATLVTFGVCSGARLGAGDDLRYEGFLRTLLGAGVRTVVGPATSVPDEAACRFAESFYGSLMQSSDPGSAFRSASSELRVIDRHPASWGSFHMYGDLRPWSAPA